MLIPRFDEILDPVQWGIGFHLLRLKAKTFRTYVHDTSVPHSPNFRKIAKSILHIFLGIAGIWKQSRLDDILYVVVSFFIPNLQYIESIPKKTVSLKC